MDWEKWVKEGGLPPVTLNFTTANLTKAQEIASEYIKDPTTSPHGYEVYEDWYSGLHVVFLEQLIAENCTLEVYKKVDSDLNVTGSSDPEVKERWYPMGIKLNDTTITPLAKKFVQEMGRYKYVKPIFQALLDSNQKDLALTWFHEKEDFYHPYVIDQLE